MSQSLAALIAMDRIAGDLEGQLYRGMRDRILQAALRPGQRLPSTRALAASLGVARSTVVHAYDRLKAEGFVEASAGASSRVAPIAAPMTLGARPTVTPVGTPRSEPPVILPLTPGVPDLGLFPGALWGRMLGASARRLGPTDLGYDHPSGLLALRQAILAHIAVNRGVVAEPEQVIILPSTRAAIAFLAPLILKQSRANTAWIEDPAYGSAQRLLREAGADLVPVPCDAAGIDIARAAGPPPAIIYVTPSHQYPTGATMSLGRRLAVLDVARSTGAIVLEDDYDAEFQFDGRPIAALQGIDRHGVVAYLGTLSKILAPGVRVAYAVLPQRLVGMATEALRLQGLSASIHVQAALAEFIAEGRLRAHIRRMTPIYAARMAAFVEAMRARCGDAVEIRAAAGGLQVAVWFRDRRLDDRAVVAALGTEGLGPQALSVLHLGEAPPGLLCGIARITMAEVETASLTIGRVLHGLLPG